MQYFSGSKRRRYEYSSSEYESSHMGSDELPLTVHNINLEPASNNLITNLPLSDELIKAMQDINSDEFSKLFNDIQESYSSLDIDAPKITDRTRLM